MDDISHAMRIVLVNTFPFWFILPYLSIPLSLFFFRLTFPLEKSALIFCSNVILRVVQFACELCEME